ncbi:MAG TPA: hypothetical protein VH575_12850 [Gemmataceae bacterium]|jgi:hypothetical protein
MIIKLVDKRLFVEGRINAFHVTMFHGEGRRASIADWESCDHKLGDDLSDPILYTCNGYHTPDLAMPSLNFIASSAARAALEGLSGLVFAPVELEKVIHLPYAAADFSYYDRADFRRDPRGCGHDTVFRRWPDRSALHPAVAPRFEVVCGIDSLLAAAYPEAREVELPDPCGDYDPEASPLSERMLAEHSLVGTMRGTAFTPEAFGRVERFLDPDYYAVADVRIG